MSHRRFTFQSVVPGGIMIILLASFIQAQKPEKTNSDAIDTSKMKAHRGFFDFFWEEETGKIWIRIDRFNEPFLYVSSLASGLGSNPVGLDRGQLGDSRVVRFRRVGPKVYLEQENVNFRAQSDSRSERQAVRDSFASSILWAGKLQKASDNSWLANITDFLLRDAHDCIGRFQQRGQGNFVLQSERSFVYLPRTKSFPNNSEFESTLTFTSTNPGPLVSRTSASGNAVTLRQHHSFVRLPDDNYTPRRFDPRSGCFKITFADYAAPITEPLEQHFITRHRLQRKPGPANEQSAAVEPIVYYVDPGAPLVIRNALIEGARWWNDAFEAAGYRNAFQVRVLPEDVDPMDVRYNVIQWVHRATRGWSYGQSVVDPRTGEIIKGHVLLGSLRVRQDHLLLEGLEQPAPPVSCSCCVISSFPDDSYLASFAEDANSLEIALARIRQLSAHEVGHTLGFAHNFAASTYGDRASVMDYPAPRASIVNGRIDLSDAYGVGIGEWDKFTVKYAYSDFAPSEEKAKLRQLVEESIARKMRYVTDADARPAGAAHPYGNLWDNGSDPVQALANEMQVRRLALDRFDATLLSSELPLSDLEKFLVPVYLHHRYQIEATAKMIGGFDYSYAIKGDQQVPRAAIPDKRQIEALRELLKTIDPVELVISQRIVDLIPPNAIASVTDRERFVSTTFPMFSADGPIHVAAELTLAALLNPYRVSRVAQIRSEEWGANELLATIMHKTWQVKLPADKAQRDAAWIVRSVFIDQLRHLTESQDASLAARAFASYRLKKLVSVIRQQRQNMSPDSEDAMRYDFCEGEIQRFLNRPNRSAREAANIEHPPGSPIGK